MSPFIETIRIENGCIYNLPYHNYRLNSTRRALFQATTEVDLADYIRPEAYRERTKCRVEYAVEVLKVEYAAYHIRPVSSLRLVEGNAVDYWYKSTDRALLNDLFGRRGEADDILIVKDGFLTDTSICNIALWNGQIWQTPHLPLLEGTKRASLINAGILFPAEIRAVDLNDYSRIRLFNALIEFGEIEIPLHKVIGFSN